MKTKNNHITLYNVKDNKRSFSGLAKPVREVLMIDLFEVDTLQSNEIPEGINMLLFRTMEESVNVYKTHISAKRMVKC